MPNVPISFQFAGLPGGSEYCFTSYQRYALDITAGLSGFLPGQFTKIINSNSEPSVDDRVGSLWFKTSDGRLYYYDGGWIAPNLAGSDERRIFVGTEAGVWAYDGGGGQSPVSNPPTPTTGAMWEVDSTFNFRFPLGAGTSPAPNNTVVGVGDIGGEEKHQLTIPELPIHTVTTQLRLSSNSGASTVAFFRSTPGSATEGAAVSDPVGGDVAHQNMPPFIGVWYIKRTSRNYYTA